MAPDETYISEKAADLLDLSGREASRSEVAEAIGGLVGIERNYNFAGATVAALVQLLGHVEPLLNSYKVRPADHATTAAKQCIPESLPDLAAVALDLGMGQSRRTHGENLVENIRSIELPVQKRLERIFVRLVEEAGKRGIVRIER